MRYHPYRGHSGLYYPVLIPKRQLKNLLSNSEHAIRLVHRIWHATKLDSFNVGPVDGCRHCYEKWR